jgi:hypothetical protein
MIYDEPTNRARPPAGRHWVSPRWRCWLPRFAGHTTGARSSDLIVASWTAATLGALVVSLRSTDGPGRRAALFRLALAGFSVAALVVAGIAAAAGADPAGACGGG